MYGEPDHAKRKDTWQLIRSLSVASGLPWVLIGDMNNVLSQEDKKGGRPYPTWLLRGFQDVLDDCLLVDMELLGYPYTWERCRGTDKWNEIRLDRAIASTSFLSHFQGAKLTNLEVSTSDHCPLFLEPVVTPVKAHYNWQFRFENAWLREPMCRQIVEDTWRNTRDKTWQEKLKMCSDLLWSWGREITGCFRDRIQRSKRMIQLLKGRRDENSGRKYQEECKRLSEIYVQQELFWKQRGKQLWLSEGDQNTKYFHTSTKVRRKNNQITYLKNDEGVEV